MGIVEKENIGDVVNFIKKELPKLKDDEEQGMTIIDKIFEKNEIYHGAFVENASDLQFFFHPPTYRISAELFREKRTFFKITKEDKVVEVHPKCASGSIYRSRS